MLRANKSQKTAANSSSRRTMGYTTSSKGTTRLLEKSDKLQMLRSTQGSWSRRLRSLARSFKTACTAVVALVSTSISLCRNAYIS